MPSGDEFIAAYDLEMGGSPARGFVLVLAAEWESDRDPVDAYRGPGYRAEAIDRKRLVQVLCDTVLVDYAGTYTCKNPYPNEELEDEIRSLVDQEGDDLANLEAASLHSDPDSAWYSEYGDVYVVATFGEWTAVNGEVGAEILVPFGYELTDRGGRIPSEESHVDLGWLVNSVKSTLAENEPRYEGLPEPLVEAVVLDELDYPRHNEVPWSVSGDVQVYAPENAEERARARRERRARRRGEPQRRRQDWRPRRKTEEESA